MTKRARQSNKHELPATNRDVARIRLAQLALIIDEALDSAELESLDAVANNARIVAERVFLEERSNLPLTAPTAHDTGGIASLDGLRSWAEEASVAGIPRARRTMAWTLVVSKAQSAEHRSSSRQLLRDLLEARRPATDLAEPAAHPAETTEPSKRRMRKSREWNERAVATYLADHAHQKPSYDEVVRGSGVARSSVGKTSAYKRYRRMLGHELPEDIVKKMSELSTPDETLATLIEEQKKDEAASSKRGRATARDD